MNPEEKVTAVTLRKAIEKTHPDPAWACFFEVADTTGYGVTRYADAVAMSLWPSRGLLIRGFEIKVSQTDLRHELAHPEKAEAVGKHCDEWWLVTPPGLVQDVEELPPAWGLMELKKGGRLKVVKKAVAKKPKLSRGFVAALLRRSSQSIASRNKGWVRKEDVEEELRKSKELVKRNTSFAASERRIERLEKILTAWRDATGIDLLETSRWSTDIVSYARCYRLGQLIIDKTRNGRALSEIASSLDYTQKNLLELVNNMRELEAFFVKSTKSLGKRKQPLK